MRSRHLCQKAPGHRLALQLALALLLAALCLTHARPAATPVQGGVHGDDDAAVGADWPCTFTSDDGVEYGHLDRLTQFFWDWTWEGLDSDPHPLRWEIGVNVCRSSASSPACRADQGGAVCIHNLTSIAQHPDNVTWPTDLLVAGRNEARPTPQFHMLDEANPHAGLALTFDNSRDAQGRRIHATIELRCDVRFATVNVSDGSWSPSQGRVWVALSSVDACPTHIPPDPFHMPVWGWVLIGVAGVIFLYVLGGCLYNSLVSGRASCPHRDFWVAGPRACGRKIRYAYHWTLNGCKEEVEVYTEL